MWYKYSFENSEISEWLYNILALGKLSFFEIGDPIFSHITMNEYDEDVYSTRVKMLINKGTFRNLRFPRTIYSDN